MQGQAQYGRKASLLVLRRGQRIQTGPAVDLPDSIIDLSKMHFRFRTAQQDVESPNNCAIRVWNLSESTVKAIQTQEYTRVIVQAGYESSGFGVIFDGSIKQFGVGREPNATDSYLDIFAADGDLAYNFGALNLTVSANSTPSQRIGAILSELKKKGVQDGYQMSYTGGVLPRGKVLFGMPKALLRQEVASQGATWSIDNGRVNIIPLDGYKPGEAVVLTAQTGLIGRPEQTNEGMRARSLLNPRIEVGSLVKIENASINKVVQQNPDSAPIAYNQYTGIQNLAHVASDGLYRVFVAEHEGDTRGQAWYTNIVGLAVNAVTKKVKPYG